MPRGTGLPGAVVQRSLADWPVVLAAWLLLVCATTLLATGVVYGDAVASGGLHRALLSAPPATRAIDVSLTAPTDSIASLDGGIRPEIENAIAATGGDIVRVGQSGSFADAATPEADVHDLTVFASVEGLDDRAALVEGAWPTAGANPIQATISDRAAQTMKLAVGDTVALVSRLDPDLRASVVVSGIWTVDPSDALWLGDELETTGVTAGGTFTTRGPLFVREADIVGLAGSTKRLQMSWRGLPAIRNLRVDGVDPLRTGTNDLAARLRGVIPASTSPRVVTDLPKLLDDVGRSVLVSRSGVILLTIQFAVLAAYAVVLVAGMLVERRRAEIALMRSRGASGLHLIAMAVIEAAVLAVPAAALAPVLALGVVALLGAVGPTAGLGLTDNAAIGQNAILVSAVAGLASIVALTLPTLTVSASPAGARAAQGRQARTTLAQRLGLDIALVAVAAVALWQLRLYGAPLTRNARGTLGLDPLLVAAPAIGLVAGAVLALRVVPRVAELGEQLLIRGRGLVASLGGRQLARRPLRYTRAALLLMLAAALGTLAAAHAATWTRSQTDQATYQAAADVRLTTSQYADLPSWAAGPHYRAVPGVAAAVPVDLAPFNIGRTIRDGKLVALDPAAVATVVTPPSDADAAPAATTLAPLVAARGSADSNGAGAAIPLPGAPIRLALTVDAAFQTPATEDTPAAPIDPAEPGFGVDVVVRDADGRLFRTAVAPASFSKTGQRVVVDLSDPAAPGLRPTAPLAVEAVELSISPANEGQLVGSTEIVALEATDEPTGDAGWAPVTVAADAPGWTWDRTEGGQRDILTPARERPNRIVVGNGQPIFGGFGATVTFRMLAMPGGSDRDIALPVVVSDAFLAKTGAAVGDELSVSTLGQSVQAKIVGTTPMFAPFDPAVPFAITDIATFEQIRFALQDQTTQADEWWIDTAPGAEPAVLTALRDRSSGATEVIGREETIRNLSTDPVPLGLIGVLGLGSVAAMLFAGIGFLVSSTISTSERIGEFALLRALGLSTGQLSLWLSIESVFLLVVGLVAGSLLGLLLAWLVLPFATLTQTGLAPIPAPVVVVPWQAIVPPYLAAVILFLLSLWLVRRQLPDIRISGVLRARES